MRRGDKTNNKIHFSLDMIDWVYSNYLQNDLTNTTRAELYTAADLGFFFFLMIGGVGKLRMSDIHLVRGDNDEYFATIAIRNSKTDQFNVGGHKALKSDPGHVCPVKTVARLVTLRDWSSASEENVLGRWLRNWPGPP